MLNNIENNSIIVVPKNIKKNVIEELNKSLLNVKIMSLEELIKKLTFDYDEKTIYNLMKKENINYDIAINYIKNIYYIDEINYNNKKLDKLVNIKKFLNENNLLIYDHLFKNYIKDKKIYIYNYTLDNYTKKILNEFDIQIIEQKNNNYNPKIYEFNTMTEEVKYVATKICELINNGININDIKLVNVSNEYENEINKIFGFFNIPINFTEKSIFGTCIVKDFINNYSNDIKNTLEFIHNKYNMKNDTNKKIYNKLIDIINNYAWTSSYMDIKELIINKLKNTKIKENMNNVVEITTLDNIKDEYVFLMNANQKEFPKINKDEDYLDDITKEKLGLETSVKLNIKEKEKTIKNIKNTKNLTITYKLKTPFNTYYKASIIDDIKSKINHITPDNEITYSKKYDEIDLSKKLDNLIKFNEKSNDLDLLYSNYTIDYNTYNNNYTHINKDKLHEYLSNKLLLSYSTMDTFYHCSFRYYLNNILKLSPYKETFYTKIGSLFHYVLENTFKNNDNYKQYFNEFKNKLKLTPKEEFLLNNLEEDLAFTIETIKKQQKYSQIKNAKYEEKIYVNKKGTVKITFMGIIDKILFEEKDNETLIALIDYKTGSTSINLNNAYYGLDLQLPVYLYLASNSNFKNIKFIGFYLQNIINNETTTKDDLTKEKEETLKLNGYSTTKQERLEYLDNSFHDSNVIKGMKTKSDGNFYSYTKVLTDEQIDNLIKLVDEKIDTATNDILDAKFDINPKQIGYKKDGLVGCKYCKFNDICFKKEENIIKLKELDYKDFLGGKNNGVD
ncbi:MAG: PD-(D/E)XK nuclease family protein [Bacilli bacterium]|nr:PD-(D/E)XK nuclease family protein [Bacilli bacterium]MBP3920038.1 PD-(D/E)XK nuclease family protein [Bacilli bacterium]